ncbi:biosynthetic-type acetolactate synthase large subunit [Candidatus Bathyarchaeota archaeon]|nr:biosynthetic-type acetolactate synthase large subunit [Candidatus Bathyarchaeota archaeon]
MVVMTGAQAYVKALEKEGVDTIFGITGAAVIPICDELLNSQIRYIGGVHEQGSTHMADGYARASGRVGVCQVTSGPGATNIVTGIATAQLDSSPVVAFTGQVPKYMVGTDAFQEVDIIGITASITKHNTQVREAKEIPQAVKSAFFISNTGRKGAVVVDLPKDTQTDSSEMVFPDKINFRGYHLVSEPDIQEIEWAAQLLARAKKPVIMAGGGVISSGASSELIELAELLVSPVAHSLMGKGSIPSTHPLNLGLCGMHGRCEANYLVPEADVLLVVGARFSDRTTGSLSGFTTNAKIIHLDVDKSEIDKNVDSITRVVGDAKSSLRMIRERIIELKQGSKNNSEWFKKIHDFRAMSEGLKSNSPINVPDIIRAIRRAMPRESIVVTDVGQHQMWSALFYDVYDAGYFLTSGGLGTMGWGTPAAIGAKVAKPDTPVLNISGDGSFSMTENNLAIAVEENLPITVVILNNNMLGMVAQWLRLFYNHRYSAVNRSKRPDFVKLAESYDAVGIHGEEINQIETEIRRSIKNKQTTVIDIKIDPEENVLPMIPPGGGLKDILIG